MRIVLTRHPAQASELEATAAAAGLDVAFMPLTQQVLPEDLAELTTAVEALERGDFDRLLITSANTVRALLACGWSGQLGSGTQVIAVGPGTGRALAELTDAPQPWMPQDYSAAGILAELDHPIEGSRMLLPQSAQARAELAQGLRSKGWQLTHVAAYRTVALDSAAASQQRHRNLLQAPATAHTAGGELVGPAEIRQDDVVLLTSSTAAEAYAQRKPSVSPMLLAIGEPTAATMTAAGLAPAQVLAEPTGSGLIAALKAHRNTAAAESLDWNTDAHTPRGGD